MNERNVLVRTPSQDYAGSSAVRLVLDFGHNTVAVGTGFIIHCEGSPHLVTAYHNLSGGVPLENRIRGGRSPRPVKVGVLDGWDTVAEFIPYENGCSLFRVHPEPAASDWCDIAAVSLETLERFCTAEGRGSAFWSFPGMDVPIEKNGYARVGDMFLPAGRPALIFGYPGGRDYHGNAVAVSCAVAAGDADASYLLLSGHMYAGCSGAPVVARDFGGYFANGNDGPQRKMRDVAVVDQWLGLYSGRLLDVDSGSIKSQETQVGIVWSPNLVRRVIAKGRRDCFPDRKSDVIPARFASVSG